MQERARDTILKSLDEFKFGRADVGVRINSVDSGLAEEDFDQIFQAKQLPQTVYLPKVENVEHVTWVRIASLADKCISEYGFICKTCRKRTRSFTKIIYSRNKKTLFYCDTISHFNIWWYFVDGGEQLVNHVNNRLLQTKEDSLKVLNIVLYIETAIGLVHLKEILQHASELSEMSRCVIDGVVFGSDDFTASIG